MSFLLSLGQGLFYATFAFWVLRYAIGWSANAVRTIRAHREKKEQLELSMGNALEKADEFAGYDPDFAYRKSLLAAERREKLRNHSWFRSILTLQSPPAMTRYEWALLSSTLLVNALAAIFRTS